MRSAKRPCAATNTRLEMTITDRPQLRACQMALVKSLRLARSAPTQAPQLFDDMPDCAILHPRCGHRLDLAICAHAALCSAQPQTRYPAQRLAAWRPGWGATECVRSLQRITLVPVSTSDRGRRAQALISDQLEPANLEDGAETRWPMIDRR